MKQSLSYSFFKSYRSKLVARSSSDFSSARRSWSWRTFSNSLEWSVIMWDFFFGVLCPVIAGHWTTWKMQVYKMTSTLYQFEEHCQVGKGSTTYDSKSKVIPTTHLTDVKQITLCVITIGIVIILLSEIIFINTSQGSIRGWLHSI